jgi:pantothenate kinase-related protein Tda10
MSIFNSKTLVFCVTEKISSLPEPILVSISGFDGSGKSTFPLALGKY